MSRLAIIGAGPAGCAAAISAASTPGVSRDQVLLLEAGSIGKDKPCGDALTPEALDELEKLGVDEGALRGLGGCSYNKVVFTHAGRSAQEVAVAPRHGWVVPRAALDRALRETASRVCDLRLQARVIAVETASTGFRLLVSQRSNIEQLEASAVIVATGSAGNISAQYNIDGDPTLAVAATQYSTEYSFKEKLFFDFRQTFMPGYVWRFPAAAKGVNWGVWATGNKNVDAFRKFRQIMVRLGRLPEYSQVRTAVARLWSARGAQWHYSSGILSCGDAAGLVDPYSGEGISAALISGAQAGSAAISYLDGYRSALREYSERLRTSFRARYDSLGERALFWLSVGEHATVPKP